MSLGATHRASGVQGTNAPEQNVQSDGESKPSSPITNLPPSDPKFFGRDEELNEIHELLQEHGSVAITQQLVPHDDGGLGKTSTAIAYGWRYLNEFPGGVFFVSGCKSIWQADMAGLAKVLGLSRQSSQQATIASVEQHLSAGARSLLILDGLDDSAQWNDMQQSGLLPKGNCQQIVTTRRQQLQDLTICTLEGLPRDQAVGMLAMYREDAGERENRSIVRDIVDWFDGLPFALSLVGAHMLFHGDTTWINFRDRLRALGIGRALPDKRRGGLAIPDYANHVRVLIDELLDAMPRQHRIALEYAALMPARRLMTKWLIALLQADESSPAGLAGGAPKPATTVASDLIFVQLLRSLSEGHKTLTLHGALRKRLLQRHGKSHLEMADSLDNVQQLAEQRAATASAMAKKSAQREELLPLLQLACCLAEHGRSRESVAVANQVAPLLHSLGRELQVVEMLKPLAEEEVIKQLAPEAAAVLLSNVAVSLAKSGQATVARRHMEQALQIEQRHLPPDDPALAIRHSNLAGILKALGDLVKARRHIETAIRIEEKHYGADHQNLAIRHWWLGDIALGEGEKDEARAEYQLAHKIMSKYHLPENPQVRMLTKILRRHDTAH